MYKLKWWGWNINNNNLFRVSYGGMLKLGVHRSWCNGWSWCIWFLIIKCLCMWEIQYWLHLVLDQEGDFLSGTQ